MAVTWSIALVFAIFAESSAGPLRYLAAAVYEFAAFLCHQRPERSFAVRGAAWPVCARCSGLYAGALIGSLVALGVRPPASWDRLVQSTRYWLPLAAAPTAVTVIAEWLPGVAPGNLTRALAAVPLGGALAGVLILAAAWPPRAVGVH